MKWNECSSPSDPTSQRSWNLAEPPQGSVTETATAPGEIPDAIVLSVEGQPASDADHFAIHRGEETLESFADSGLP